MSEPVDFEDRPGADRPPIPPRPRKSIWQRLLVPALVLSLLANVVLAQRGGWGPSTARESYVAGPIGLGHPKVVIIELDGVINDSTHERIARQVRQASQDDDIKAVVLRVDSPGGTVVASDRIWREVRTWLKGKKPIVISMGGTAASGGYYVAAAGDVIHAEPTTLTGSIGVILELPHLEGLMEKVGVGVETIKTGPMKDTGSIYRKLGETERRRWSELLDHSYQRFLRVIAQGRDLKLSEIQPLADGRVYTAEEARGARLIDQIGYLDDAIEDARRRAGQPRAQVVKYQVPASWADLLSDLPGLSSTSLRPSWEDVLPDRTPRLMMIAR